MKGNRRDDENQNECHNQADSAEYVRKLLEVRELLVHFLKDGSDRVSGDLWNACIDPLYNDWCTRCVFQLDQDCGHGIFLLLPHESLEKWKIARNGELTLRIQKKVCDACNPHDHRFLTSRRVRLIRHGKTQCVSRLQLFFFSKVPVNKHL